ncbi:hypothetical protein M0R72_10685 [Candidatus Pacearchaeota archaeon]|nr:hypothetical protein [Candidatus Pacearchaeota archaeon]
MQDSRETVIAVCAGETIAQRMQDTYNALDGIPDSELAEFVRRAKEDRRKAQLFDILCDRLCVDYKLQSLWLSCAGRDIRLDGLSFDTVNNAARELGLEVSDA